MRTLQPFADHTAALQDCELSAKALSAMTAAYAAIGSAIMCLRSAAMAPASTPRIVKH